MAPFEALYGRGSISPIGWFEAGDVKLFVVDLVKDSEYKVRSILNKLLASLNKQNKYAYHKVRDKAFEAGEQVLLKVSLLKGLIRFGKKGKLNPRYVGPFEILDYLRSMTYRLALPPKLP